jgi:hypothetical protein
MDPGGRVSLLSPLDRVYYRMGVDRRRCWDSALLYPSVTPPLRRFLINEFEDVVDLFLQRMPHLYRVAQQIHDRQMALR